MKFQPFYATLFDSKSKIERSIHKNYENARKNFKSRYSAKAVVECFQNPERSEIRRRINCETDKLDMNTNVEVSQSGYCKTIFSKFSLVQPDYNKPKNLQPNV